MKLALDQKKGYRYYHSFFVIFWNHYASALTIILTITHLFYKKFFTTPKFVS